jgi:competence protein ComFC
MCRLFDKDICICQQCQKLIEPKFIGFKASGYKALAFYDYNEFIKQQIYLFKGCFDYEMKDVFLNLFIKETKLYYSRYVVIPIPSYSKDDEIRGFNHVVEVFKNLGVKLLPIIEKTAHFKQAENSAKKRQDIKKHLALKEQVDLSKQRVLLVDDIYTTGSTMAASIKLIEKLNPKEIRVLVLAKTNDKDYKKPNTNNSLH